MLKLKFEKEKFLKKYKGVKVIPISKQEELKLNIIKEDNYLSYYSDYFENGDTDVHFEIVRFALLENGHYVVDGIKKDIFDTFKEKPDIKELEKYIDFENGRTDVFNFTPIITEYPEGVRNLEELANDISCAYDIFKLKKFKKSEDTEEIGEDPDSAFAEIMKQYGLTEEM